MTAKSLSVKLPSELVLSTFKLIVVPMKITSGSVVEVCEPMGVDVDGPLSSVSECMLAGDDGLLIGVSELMLTGVDGLLFGVEILQLLQTQVVLALLG